MSAGDDGGTKAEEGGSAVVGVKENGVIEPQEEYRASPAKEESSQVQLPWHLFPLKLKSCTVAVFEKQASLFLEFFETCLQSGAFCGGSPVETRSGALQGES